MKKTALTFIVLLIAAIAHAHPGRLDKDGCHYVLKDWKYKSGKVLKAGTYHCHRGLDRMKLDGKELLEDPDDPGEEVKPEPAKEKNRNAK